MIIYSLLIIVLMILRPQGLFTWSLRAAGRRMSARRCWNSTSARCASAASPPWAT